MIAAVLVDALGLPAETNVARRIPKTLLLERGLPTTADKRSIRDGVEQLTWVASLKPTTIGVPAFRNDVREYLEIAVLAVALRDDAKTARIIELVHRIVPYPVALCVEQAGTVALALAHKRRSQGEAGEFVLDEWCRTASMSPNALTDDESAFLTSLALSGLRGADMYAVYQAWFDRVVALEAASITGEFDLPESPDQAASRRAALTDYARLKRDLAALRNEATREQQLKRLVDINLAVKHLESELTTAVKAL